MKIWRIAQSSESKVLYHITTKSNAESIMTNGFNPKNSCIFFAIKDHVKEWFNTLQKERSSDYPNLALEDIEKMDTKTKRLRNLKEYMLKHKKQAIEWNDPVVIEVVVPLDFFNANFIDRSQLGYKEIYYQDRPSGKWSQEKGWHEPEYTKPVLQNGVNCSMRIVNVKDLL